MIDQLITEWNTWCSRNNLPCISADELFHEKYNVLTDYQKSYILGFITRWEDAEETF